MASRRDLFQAHQFMVQRVVSGLVLRESDPPQSPLRRMGGTVFAGVMVAVLSLAVAGVIGVISPGGNTTWQESGAVILEEGTGARYVWLADEDGVEHLHPVVNFASGALLTGGTDVVSVSAASLADAPRGRRLGIVGGPDGLPEPGRLADGGWTLCSAPARLDSGEQQPLTAVVVGSTSSGGVALGERAVLVRDVERGTLHLVWQGHQYPVPDEDAVLEGLTLRTQPQVEVGTAWLSGLPAGEPLQPEPVAGRGAASAAVAGAVVGQVRVVRSGDGAQYYQVAADRIVEITEVQAAVLLAAPETAAQAYGGAVAEALPLTAAEANAAPREELPDAVPTDPPAAPPAMAEVVGPEDTVCAGFSGATATPSIAVGATVDTTGASPSPRQADAGTVLADLVVVAPGSGALVEARPSGEASRGALFLVTDEGWAYPVPSEDAAARLGYGGVEPVAMPDQLVARVPTGPALTVTAAGAPALG
ncbi:type VII secretion protein EccB [Blastococcus sp. TF02A-26]|uniref:type VII secretion protein EccB n=1 Tax=Blastococcus sp. TF02A-26 TaxID=2250577 RepID=UPI000DEA85A3|nr:type VII secretion protein EccB [Blastococcus sp. TF02A-26]RBY86113.1 type VII secretion protein EccB [Blastococcus sp. TF02A-26]